MLIIFGTKLTNSIILKTVLLGPFGGTYFNEVHPAVVCSDLLFTILINVDCCFESTELPLQFHLFSYYCTVLFFSVINPHSSKRRKTNLSRQSFSLAYTFLCITFILAHSDDCLLWSSLLFWIAKARNWFFEYKISTTKYWSRECNDQGNVIPAIMH